MDSIAEILDHSAIELPRREHSTYCFSLEEIPQTLTIRIYEVVLGRGFVSEQSHFMKTPMQATPHRSNSTSDDSIERVLRKTLNTLTSHYDAAVQAGHEPEVTWLVKNENFI